MIFSVDSPPVLRMIIRLPGSAVHADRVGLHLVAVVHLGHVAEEHHGVADPRPHRLNSCWERQGTMPPARVPCSLRFRHC